MEYLDDSTDQSPQRMSYRNDDLVYSKSVRQGKKLDTPQFDEMKGAASPPKMQDLSESRILARSSASPDGRL